MHPCLQTASLEIWQRCLILFCQRRGEEPRLHHADVIFLSPHRRDRFQNFGGKCIVQTMIHQHLDGKAHSVFVLGCDPLVDLPAQRRPIFPECLRRELIAGGPVVHPGEKGVRQRQSRIKILFQRDQKGVELVLLKIDMRQGAEKCLCLFRAAQFLCERPQRRRAHADESLFLHGGYQRTLKRGIVRVLQGEQPFLYGSHRQTPLHPFDGIILQTLTIVKHRRKRIPLPECRQRCGWSVNGITEVVGLLQLRLFLRVTGLCHPGA